MAQKSQPADQLMFVLSANFAQALKRIQYFKDMTSYREQQVKQIEDAQVNWPKKKRPW